MTRAFEPTGMTTAKWRQIPPRAVPVGSLMFSQRHLYIDGLLKAARGEPSYCGDDCIHVIKKGDSYYISDGHHRAAVALIRGQETIEARVLEL